MLRLKCQSYRAPSYHTQSLVLFFDFLVLQTIYLKVMSAIKESYLRNVLFSQLLK
jgi:hypothetical protein